MGPPFHIGVLFHILGVLIRIEMGIPVGVGPEGMAKNMLGDIYAGDLVLMGGRGMAEQPGVELFIKGRWGRP